MPPTSTPPPTPASKSSSTVAAAVSPALKPDARPSSRYAWKRNPVFRFFSSVRLAVVLLIVVIIASAAGTIYESNFDAKVARAYVYNARWFNIWLLVLGLNLLCAALSRLPWKRHHTGFLITHLGIIILLIGAVVGRTFGIEGTMTIFKGQPPNSELIIDEHVLRLEENGTPLKPYPISVIGRRPTAEKPWTLGYTPNGWKVEMTDFSERLNANFEPQAVPAAAASNGIGGQPAVRVHLTSKRLKQNIDNWLLAGDQEHGSLDLGLASVQLRRGVAPAPTPAPVAAPAPAATPAPAPVAATPTPAADQQQQPPAPAADGSTAAPAPPASAAAATPVPRDATSGTPPAAPAVTDPNAVDEVLFAFALKPGEQVSQPVSGKSSGVKVRFADPAKREVTVEWRGATWVFNIDTDANKPQDLSGSGINVTIEGYWNDFVAQNGQPANASAEPKNPAVSLHVRGKLPPLTDNDPFADTGGHVDTNAAAATTNPNSPGAENQAILYCDEKGALTFSLKTSASPELIYGKMTAGQPINTGWADWQIQAEQVMPQAVPQTNFRAAIAHGSGEGAAGAAAGGMMGGSNATEGVRVRLSRSGESHEEWVASGWKVTYPTSSTTTQLTYGFRIEPLPVGIELTNFEVERQEGNDSPAAFKSSVRVSDADGNSGSGSCSMNEPFNFPGHWWNTFTGLTYKVSQASWNPDNLNQSAVQILRDPGWTFKWIGSLLICCGIFTLFYLRPTPRGQGERKQSV